MADWTYEPTRPLTLGSIMPVSHDTMTIPLPEDEDGRKNYIKTKLCRKAEHRDELIALQQPGYMVMGQGGERKYQLGSDVIPGTRGPMTFARYCWMNFVTEYEFPSGGGRRIKGNCQAQPSERSDEHFEELFGRSSEVLDYFVAACRAAHRLDPQVEAKVEEELGNFDDGATTEPAT